MKKLFTIALSALLMLIGIQSVSAQTAIFSLTTTGDGEATVGSFEKKSVNNSEDTQDPKRWTMNSSGAYIQCTCSQALAVGDEIAITGTPQAASSDGFCIRLTGDYTADAQATLKNTSKKKKYQTVRYTVEEGNGLVGQTTFYVMIENKSHSWWIDKIEVTASSTTGISSAPVGKKSSQNGWYDLQGHKITNPQKGNIYLKDGKKIVF